MNAQLKITEKLQDKTFKWKGKEYGFISCKPVATFIMIITTTAAVQIDNVDVDNFLDTVEVYEKPSKNAGMSLAPTSTLAIESPAVFTKLNASFETLIDLLDSATEADLPMLEIKAKMLTSLGNTAVSMENSKREIYKALTGK